MNFFGAAFIKALIVAVLLSSFLVDDAHGVTIVVRPSYRRIRIQGPSPTSSSSTSTTTTTAAATTTSEETTDETTTLASNEEQDDDDDDVTSLPVEVPVEENSPSSVPESPEVTTSGELEDEIPTEEEEEVDNSIRGGSDEQQQPSTAASVEEEAAVTTNVPISPTAESVVVDTDTSSASSVPERSSRLLAEEPTTTLSAEVETMPEEEEQTQETPAEAVNNNISQETAPESTTENEDPLPPNTTEAISVEESGTDQPTTILPVPLVVEDFMNELVGPGREAKAIDDETVDGSSANNLAAEPPIEEKEEGDSEESKDVWGGMFGAADPFLSVMGGMLSTSTTPATDIATQATTIASSSIFKALFTESPVESSTENAQQEIVQVSEPTVEREASSELASGGQFEATSTESATTITSPEAPELPAPLNRPGAFLSESTLKNLELLLEQDRKFREEQEQALSFLKSIKTPLALDETVEVDKSGGFKSSSTAFPPIDTAPGAGGIVEEEEPPVSAEEEEEIGQRHQTGFFGGFRQLPPNLQTSGLSLPSQHQIGRPLFAARPFPGPLPPTLSGFPRATLLQPPNVPGGLSRRPSNDEEEEEPASRVVDPFLAASSPPLSVSRQRSAANKRSPPPPILVFDSPRSAPTPVSSPSVVTLLPSASRPAVQFMSRPVISRPAVTSAFRAAPVRRPSVPRSRLPTASASSAGLSDTILAASASGGNPFLVRLPSDRGRAGRQVVLQSHPDTEFVYTV